MTRPYSGPGYSMNRSKRPPVNCAVCNEPIEHPTFNQKVHAGKCHREWNNRNSAKFHAKARASKLAKRDRRRVRVIKGVWPPRSKTYRRWIATQPCTLDPNCKIPADAHPVNFIIEHAHTGAHGISQKASDYDGIPLHHYCHQEAKDAQGKSRDWFEQHGLDREKVLADLRARYAAQRRDAA